MSLLLPPTSQTLFNEALKHLTVRFVDVGLLEAAQRGI